MIRKSRTRVSTEYAKREHDEDDEGTYIQTDLLHDELVFDSRRRLAHPFTAAGDSHSTVRIVRCLEYTLALEASDDDSLLLSFLGELLPCRLLVVLLRRLLRSHLHPLLVLLLLPSSLLLLLFTQLSLGTAAGRTRRS